MHWVLILVIVAKSYMSVATSSTEFNTEKACKDALHDIALNINTELPGNSTVLRQTVISGKCEPLG